jgi:hypothetical protein
MTLVIGLAAEVRIAGHRLGSHQCPFSLADRHKSWVWRGLAGHEEYPIEICFRLYLENERASLHANVVDVDRAALPVTKIMI